MINERWVAITDCCICLTLNKVMIVSLQNSKRKQEKLLNPDWHFRLYPFYRAQFFVVFECVPSNMSILLIASMQTFIERRCFRWHKLYFIQVIWIAIRSMAAFFSLGFVKSLEFMNTTNEKNCQNNITRYIDGCSSSHSTDYIFFFRHSSQWAQRGDNFNEGFKQ